MDGQTEGWKDGWTDEPITIAPFDLRQGTKSAYCNINVFESHGFIRGNE